MPLIVDFTRVNMRAAVRLTEQHMFAALFHRETNERVRF